MLATKGRMDGAKEKGRDMTAELMRTKRDALLNWIFAFTTCATRTLKANSRKLGGPREFYQGAITLVLILVATALAPHASAQGGCEVCGVWVEPCRAAPSGGCGKQKCDSKSACQDVAKLKELMNEYSKTESQYPGSFMKFNNAFSPLLSKLTNSDLACAFDPGSKDIDPNPALAQLLMDINRDRNGFQTLNQSSAFPSEADCFHDAKSERCGDYNKTQDISQNLDRFSCPGDSGGGPPGGCPSISSLEDKNKKVESATKLTGWLPQRVTSTDPEMKKGFEMTKRNFEDISKALKPIIKAGKDCEKVEKLLKELDDFLKAIDEINSAGCNSQQLARGFDDLFRSAGKLGTATLSYPVFTPIFKILAEDQNFFTKVEGSLNPEQRWSRQF